MTLMEPALAANSQDGQLLSALTVMVTSGQSNLTKGRIAATHGRFSRIHQVARMCPPM